MLYSVIALVHTIQYYSTALSSGHACITALYRNTDSLSAFWWGDCKVLTYATCLTQNSNLSYTEQHFEENAQLGLLLVSERFVLPFERKRRLPYLPLQSRMQQSQSSLPRRGVVPTSKKLFPPRLCARSQPIRSPCEVLGKRCVCQSSSLQAMGPIHADIAKVLYNQASISGAVDQLGQWVTGRHCCSLTQYSCYGIPYFNDWVFLPDR